MKILANISTLTIILWLIIGGCSNRIVEVHIPQVPVNLITNGSFEIDHQASLIGWSPDTTMGDFVNYSTDTPLGGGSFSIKLRNEWSFAGVVSQTFVPPSGTHQYRLSVASRVVRLGWNAGGNMWLYINRGDSLTMINKFHFADTVWTFNSIIDTYTINTGDTMSIILRGNIDQWSYGYILFDMIKFEKLD